MVTRMKKQEGRREERGDERARELSQTERSESELSRVSAKFQADDKPRMTSAQWPRWLSFLEEMSS